MDIEEISKKREKEKQTVRFMISIYCHRKHGTKGDSLCNECSRLAEYAADRVDHCPHMAEKTFCTSCKTHCYKPDMREKIRCVMRFSGPRMMFYCPAMAIRHGFERKKK